MRSIVSLFQFFNKRIGMSKRVLIESNFKDRHLQMGGANCQVGRLEEKMNERVEATTIKWEVRNKQQHCEYNWLCDPHKLFWQEYDVLSLKPLIFNSFQNMKITTAAQSLLSEEQEEPQQRQDPVFELFEKAGTFGKYQKITFIFWCLACYLCGGITLIIPFLFYQDPYQCPSTYPQQTCTQYVCSLVQSERAHFIPQRLMQTMANKFGNYRCPQDSELLDLAVMVIYSSGVLAYVILALFGDYIGRKRLMQLGALMVLGGLAVTIFAVDLIMGTGGMFLSCLGAEWIYTFSLMFISQTVEEKHRDKFLVGAQMFYGIGHLGNAGFYFWLRDWQSVFLYLYMVPAVIFLIGLSIFAVDTPMCLINYLSANKARKAFVWIAKINGKKDFYVTLDQIKELKEIQQIRSNQNKEGSKFNFIDLFRYPSLRSLTLKLILLLNCIMFLFYAPTLMIGQFDLDIFVSGLVIGFSSFAAYPFCYWAITRVKRRLMALICYGCVFGCSLVLVFVWHPKIEEVEVQLFQQIGMLCLFFLISFIITTQYVFNQVYILELYPTQIRIIGASFAPIIGGIMIAFVDFIIDACQNSGFSIMIVFCILSLVSMMVSLKLPQTFQKTSPDFIQELTEQIQSKMHHNSKRVSQETKPLDDSRDQDAKMQ